MKTLYKFYFISLFFISMANAGISDNEIESFIKQCIGEIIPSTRLLRQSEKKEIEEDLKFQAEIFSLIEERKPDEAYYKIKDIESERYGPLYSPILQSEKITELLLHIKKQAESNEKVIQEKSKNQWLNQFSEKQVDFLASFFLMNTAIYWHVNKKVDMGKKNGYICCEDAFLSQDEVAYVDNNKAACRALENYSDAKSHHFPIKICFILEDVSNNLDEVIKVDHNLPCIQSGSQPTLHRIVTHKKMFDSIQF